VPAASDAQNALPPMPMGDTTPTPVTTMSLGLAIGCTLLTIGKPASLMRSDTPEA
jgi:hypothetical protein